MENTLANDYWIKEDVKVHTDVSEDIMKFYADKLIEIMLLNSSDDIIDAGCGDGKIDFYLKGFVNSISGFDFSQKYIQNAKETIKGGTYWTQSFLDDYGVGVYSKAFSFSVMQYCQPHSIHDFLDKSIQAVKQNGKVYHFDVPHKKKMWAYYLKNYRGLMKPKAFLKYFTQLLRGGVIDINDGSYCHDLEYIQKEYNKKGYNVLIMDSWSDYRSHIIIEKK